MSKGNNIKLLYIDLFCGAGGTSTGVHAARYAGEECAKVIACVNHDKNAIASHAANHPETLHFTEDIRTIKLSPILQQLAIYKEKYPNALVVLWASLECTNFSKAKGGKPRDADSRTLAEHLFRYIDAISPDYVQIENVQEFMSWGEVDENGKPISMDKGKSYERWVNNVTAYGYKFDYRILNAANFGAYTSRQRFFGIFAKENLPIAFPTQTHWRQTKKQEIPEHLQWKPVKDVLNLDDEGVSIFGRKKPLAENTLKRIYAGLIKFVAGGKDQWILKYNSMNQATGHHTPPGIDEPCPTVSCQNRLGVVKTERLPADGSTIHVPSVHFLSKQYSGHPDSKNIGVDGPAGAITCKDHHVFISAYYGGQFTPSIDEPCPTLTTHDRLSLISSQFMDMQYGNGTPTSIDEPAATVTTSPKHNLVTINARNYYLMNPQYSSAGGSVDTPCFTLIARMDKMPPYLVSTEVGCVGIEVYPTDSEMTCLIKEFMAIYGIVDIKMRMLQIPELKRIMGFPNDYQLIGTQAEQKKYIGNAVEVTMSKVLCEALCKELSKIDASWVWNTKN